jgi:hypothetical protein
MDPSTLQHCLELLGEDEKFGKGSNGISFDASNAKSSPESSWKVFWRRSETAARNRRVGDDDSGIYWWGKMYTAVALLMYNRATSMERSTAF